jgi:hypothetical protein
LFSPSQSRSTTGFLVAHFVAEGIEPEKLFEAMVGDIIWSLETMTDVQRLY